MKVIFKEEYFLQHRWVIINLMMEHRAVKQLNNYGKVKLRRLRDEIIKRIMKDAKEKAVS